MWSNDDDTIIMMTGGDVTVGGNNHLSRVHVLRPPSVTPGRDDRPYGGTVWSQAAGRQTATGDGISVPSRPRRSVCR